MTTTTTNEIQALGSLMAVDEDNELWLGGDGLKDAQIRADVYRLIELGIVRVEGVTSNRGHSDVGYGVNLYVNAGYEKYFARF